MFSIDRFAELLINILPRTRYASGKKELETRCMYCGDSNNRKSAHFYISLDDTKPIFYYCQKCHIKGIVTHNKLIEWGVFDQEIYTELSVYNKNMLSKKENYIFTDKLVYKLNNKYILDDNLSRDKLSYINNRLGIELSYEELLSKKIVLNLYDLLSTNYIDKFTRHESIIKELNNSFIGFISQDNAFLNMRNLRQGKVYKTIDKKYINYNIFGKFDNTKRYYTIPTSIDLKRGKRIKIHIAEGPFDILSIYYNVRNREDHSIYSAIIGSSYLNLIKDFLLNMKLIYIEFHIYLDNDINEYIVENIYNYLKIFDIPLYIHKNIMINEKDFGVSKDRITERIEKIY